MIATDMTAHKLADEAIGLFLEYRDVHGHNEVAARDLAVAEVLQGIEAEQELRAHGELPARPKPKCICCPEGVVIAS